MSKQEITILHLYPLDMNIYGDYGNILVLSRRLEKYGYTPKVISYNVGDAFPDDVDIVVGGGGQDSGQDKVQADLLSIGPKLKKLARMGTPMLMVCGLYQLFGHSFTTAKGEIIKGIGLFDAVTIGLSERLIGNTIIESNEFGEIIGYENHSGQTFLGPHVGELGIVRVGAGNNLKDISEGARYLNVIGTYLHGSLLPKNPKVADFLIKQAVINRYKSFTHTVIDDSLADKARKVARRRPR